MQKKNLGGQLRLEGMNEESAFLACGCPDPRVERSERETQRQVDRSIDKIENACGLPLLMNERLVNIVKKREGEGEGA